MTGHNVGDLLNNAGITWGWFYADFTAQTGSTSTHAVCSSNYDVHYDPFQYYPSTVNPHQLPPTSTALIGRQGGPGKSSIRSQFILGRAQCRQSAGRELP
jgi:phospholipase C